MRLKSSSAAAVAPALQLPPHQIKTKTASSSRLRAVPRKGAAPAKPPAKPMAVSGTLHTRSTAKAEATAKLAAAQQSAQQTAKMDRRDRVVLEHLPLVKAIAIRVHENLPVHVDVDDLVHAGILGLFDAASKFNPEKQVAFSSSTVPRATCAAAINKWKPPRASWPPPCSAIPPNSKSRRSWASIRNAG